MLQHCHVNKGCCQALASASIPRPPRCFSVPQSAIRMQQRPILPSWSQKPAHRSCLLCRAKKQTRQRPRHAAEIIVPEPEQTTIDQDADLESPAELGEKSSACCPCQGLVRLLCLSSCRLQFAASALPSIWTAYRSSAFLKPARRATWHTLLPDEPAAVRRETRCCICYLLIYALGSLALGSTSSFLNPQICITVHELAMYLYTHQSCLVHLRNGRSAARHSP